jgi:hypothetical protein
MIGRIWTPFLDRAKEALIKEGLGILRCRFGSRGKFLAL